MSEDKPHVVYPRALLEGPAILCRNYSDAYSLWRQHHHYKTPYLIATLGRVIDPSTPIVDVNE